MSAAAKSAPAPRKRKANGYKFPEKFPLGEVLQDCSKKEWVLGPSIGKGGFGEVYSAKLAGGRDSKYSYVVKIEPHENGPLFVEKSFYLRVAKKEFVEEWAKSEKVSLGIPIMQGTGCHTYKGEKYRFIVLERYGQDLWTKFKEEKVFPLSSICQYAIQIIDMLHFIHSKGYVHADIKGANLLFGKSNQLYLVDFGIACRYTTTEFKRDPKRAHNGTIEFTSVDWHDGVPTRRGDLEILGYNLLMWANSSLPWEKDIKSAEKVHQKKSELMSSVKAYIKKNCPSTPPVLIEFLDYVSKLKPNEEPNYKQCKSMFLKALDSSKRSLNGHATLKSPPLRSSPRLASSGTPKGKEPPPKKKRTPILDKTNDKDDDDVGQKTEDEIDNDCDIIEQTPPENLPNKRGRKKAAISWRDAPTVKASLAIINSGEPAGKSQRKRK